jgi:hypothetical protein
VPIIDPETLRGLEERIFGSGQGSVESAAAEFQRVALEQTIREPRRAMRTAIGALPDRAFDAQPTGPEGEAVWSAGEVVGHIAESMLWLEFALTRLSGGDPTAPLDMPGVIVRDRAESLATLELADRVLGRNLASTTALSDEPRMDIEGLGTLGVRGLLLLHAMHEVEHAGQLAALGTR